MKPKLPSNITVLVDTREKIPLLFPETLKCYPQRGSTAHLFTVKQAKTSLPEGDYALKGFQDVCLVERKGSLRELSNNLLSEDWARFHFALFRLSEACEFPVLLLDIGMSEIVAPTRYVPDPPKVLDAFLAALHHHRVDLLWGANAKKPGPRRALGELVLRILLSRVFEKSLRRQIK